MDPDLTEAEIRQIAEKLRALLKPLCEAYRIKYVLTGAVQKESDPNLGTHFAICSDEDPRWAIIAIARTAQALQSLVDPQS